MTAYPNWGKGVRQSGPVCHADSHSLRAQGATLANIRNVTEERELAPPPDAVQKGKKGSRQAKYILIALGVVFLLIVIGILWVRTPSGSNSSGVESLRITATCAGCDPSTTYGQEFSGHIFNSTGGRSSSYNVVGNGSQTWIVSRQPQGGGWYVSWSFGSYSIAGTLTVIVQLDNGRVIYDNSAPGFASSLYGNYQQASSATG